MGLPDDTRTSKGERRRTETVVSWRRAARPTLLDRIGCRLARFADARAGLLAAFIGSLAVACNRGAGDVTGPADVAATVAQAAAAVAGQSAPLADEHQQGKHLGFDTSQYPGDATMHAWKNAPGAPYSWVGYYLPSPCHQDASWSGKRDTLRAMGWGLAVVYVGQQTWGRTPRRLSAKALATERRRTHCSADYLSAAEGAADADDAARRAAAEGFPAGSIVYLDIERTDRMPTAMREYYKAWVARMLAGKRYVPGIYAHTFNADLIYADVKAVFAATGLQSEPRFWIASTKDFAPDKAPYEVGHDFAGVWQGVVDVARAVAGVKLPIDINVSAWASPSETESAQGE